MENTTRLLLPDVSEALRTDPQLVIELTEEMHPADLADLVAALEHDLARRFIQVVPVDIGASILDELDDETRRALVIELAAEDPSATADLSEEMSPDERADLISELPDETREKIMSRMRPGETREVERLLAFEDGTAGRLMTTSFVALRAEFTIEKAIEEVRRVAAEMETIYAAFAVDPNGTLLGAISLRDLVTAPPGKTVADLMEPHVISAWVDDDEQEVARLIAKYDLLALPVIDRSNKIIGIITVDDVVDVVQEKASDDVQRLGGVSPLEATYFQTSVREFVQKRVIWLVLLFVGGFFTGTAMKGYSGSLDAVKTLIWFVPLIMSAGGNAGSQSASLMIRSLAVGDVLPQDFAKVISRELLIGALLGLSLSVFGIVRALMWKETRTFEMALTVGLTLPCVVTAGAVIGSAMPLLLKRMGLDPAVSSTPFIASLSDVLGLVIYFEMAKLILF
jgi:magnesium transporter